MNWSSVFSKKLKVFGFFLFLFFVAYNSFIKDNFSDSGIKVKAIAVEQFGDIVIGDKDAKNQVFVLFGCSCPHCRVFIGEKLKSIQQFVARDKKTKIALRMLVDTNFAVKFASFMHCKNKTEQEKLGILGVVINNFSEIMGGKNPEEALFNVLKRNNINTDDFYQCTTNYELQQKLLKITQEVIKSGVRTIPTVVINGKLSSLQELEDLIR